MSLKYYVEPQGEPILVPSPSSGVELETFIPWTLVKRGVKKEIIRPIDTPGAFREEAADRQRQKTEQHSPVARVPGLAYYWQSLIDAGRFDSFSAIAAAEGMSKGRVSRRIMQLLQLSPERVHEALKVPGSNQLDQMIGQDIPLCWERQIHVGR